LSFLDNGTQSTATVHQQIVHKAASDSLLLPDLSTDGRREVNIGEGHHHHKAAQQAVVSYRFSILTGSVTWDYVGHKTKRDVAETTANTVTPFRGHFEL
jgi:hypothetical protein